MLCSAEGLRLAQVMSHNFTATRRLRRAVLKDIEQQQKADSEAAMRIRNCILAGTKELLQSLSVLLEAYVADGDVSQAERQVFVAIAPSLSLDEWLHCRQQHHECERRSASLRERLVEAQKGYDEIAPLGIFSKLLKNENEKRIFDALKSNRDKLANDLSANEEELSRLESGIREKSKEFLKQAMKKESLDFLRNASSPISNRVKTNLEKMREEVGDLVNAHAAAQRRSLDSVQQNITALTGAYQDYTPLHEQ
jgi:gas vesicle protein